MIKTFMEEWKTILIVVIIAGICGAFCGCSELDDLVGHNDNQCLRDDAPQPPMGPPDETLWYQESHKGQWLVSYEYYCINDEYRLFIYCSPDECTEWFWVRKITDECIINQ